MKLGLSRLIGDLPGAGDGGAGPRALLESDDGSDGYGMVQDQFLAQWARRIGGGTEQIQRNLVAERALGLPATGSRPRSQGGGPGRPLEAADLWCRWSPTCARLVGITGAVAVGKSVLASAVAERIGAEVVASDEFLFPNAVLADRDLTHRKGFPESFDAELLAAALDRWRATGATAVPLYSHLAYDIVPLPPSGSPVGAWSSRVSTSATRRSAFVTGSTCSCTSTPTTPIWPAGTSTGSGRFGPRRRVIDPRSSTSSARSPPT